MNIIHLIYGLIVLIISIISIKSQTETQSKGSYDELLQWSKAHHIYLHPNITLTKSNPNEYYFTTHSNFPSNTLLLSIPNKLLITSSALNSKTKHKGLRAIWDKLQDTQSIYIKVQSTKEMMYIALMLEHSMRKAKGRIYSLFKSLITSYPENMDNFPMYYTTDEQRLLKNTHFLGNLIDARTSLEEEERIINRNLSHSSMISDDYWRYRIIILANSVQIQNKTTLVPLLNHIAKDINDKHINANWVFNTTTNQFEVYSNRNIPVNTTITIQGYKIPNAVLLLYYGFTYERNEYIGQIVIDVLHKKFKAKLANDNHISVDDIDNITLYKNTYDLGKQEFITEIFDVYRILAVRYHYGPTDANVYQMMADNLKYYLEEYEAIKESDYTEFILSKRNRVNIRRVIEDEKRVFVFKLNHLRSLIDKTKTNKKANNKSDL